MFRLDDELLKELGLIDLPPEEKKNMFNHIYETLEMRVGTRLANQMTEEQLTEFESYIDKNDEAGALKWLETNFPDYKQVVANELEKLKAEIKQVAPQILASIRDKASQAVPPQASPPQQALPPQDPTQYPAS
jgi:predicted RNA-binding Zn ribbon-like protein